MFGRWDLTFVFKWDGKWRPLVMGRGGEAMWVGGGGLLLGGKEEGC